MMRQPHRHGKPPPRTEGTPYLSLECRAHAIVKSVALPSPGARMPDLTIHAIPQDDLDALDARARRHGRTAETEVLHLIHEAAGAERLVQQLEKAHRAEDAIRRSELRSGARGPATQRQRYHSVEPTPHRTRHLFRDVTRKVIEVPRNPGETPLP
jgi:plasmid stability protein